MIRLGAIVAWLATAILFSLAAWQVVQATDEQTTDAPAAPVVYASGLSTTTSTTIGATVLTSAPFVPVTNPVTASSTIPDSNSTSTTPPSPSTTTTDDSSSQGVSADPDRRTRLIETKAGQVSVWFVPGEVHFISASPLVGWAIEVDETGPLAVEVKFERDETDIEVTVEWEDHELVVDIDEETEDNEDESDDR